MFIIARKHITPRGMLYRARIALESYSNRARIAIVIGPLVQSGGGKHALRLYPPAVVHHIVSVPVFGLLLQYRTALMNRVIIKFQNMQAVNISFLLYRPDTKLDTLLPYKLYQAPIH